MRIHCHSNKLFCDLGILKLFDLIKLRISRIMFKTNNELLPGNLQQFFNVKYTMLHVIRQSNKLKHVYARTTLKAKCTSVYGVKLWNSLDESIRSSVTIHQNGDHALKQHVKKTKKQTTVKWRRVSRIS